MQAPQSRKGSALSTSHDTGPTCCPRVASQQLPEPRGCARLSLNLLVREEHWLTAA